MALKMKQSGLPAATIASITGMTVHDIDAL